MAEEKKEKTFLEKLISFKTLVVSIPFIGLALWWAIKLLICFFTGVCIL